MRSILIGFSALLIFAGCSDDSTPLKEFDGNPNNQAVNNGGPNNANNQNNANNVVVNNQNNANNVVVNNQNNANNTSLMDRFGTEGPVDMMPKSPGGNALCDLNSIRTDDLAQEFDSSVPPMPWDTSVVADAPARCGDDAETTVWRLTNCERMARDLAPMECDLRLVWLGRAHSQDMIDRGFFAHTNPDNASPFERMADAGIQSRASAENIAQNPSAEGAHLSWMDSSGHRRNMLGAYTHVGTGFVGNLYTSGFITQ